MEIPPSIFAYASLFFATTLSGQTVSDLGNQDLAKLGLVDVSAAPFYADPSGVQDSTEAINAAILFARDHQMVAYLPVGDYRISDTIEMLGKDPDSPNSSMNDYFCVFQGESQIPGSRSRLVLEDYAADFSSRNPVKFVLHAYRPEGNDYAYTTHYNQVVRSIDIVIGEGNSGAVGLRMQGAEGCLVEDVHIDATNGWKGVWGLPGSGGSTHGLSVTGGEIGVDLRGFNEDGQAGGVGTQPGPMISQLRLTGQTEVPLALQIRGALVVVGADIQSDSADAVFQITPAYSKNPWSSSVSLVDASLDFSGANGQPVVVDQVGSRGRGFTLYNVHLRGFHKIASEAGISLDPNVWTLCREVAVAGNLPSPNGYDLTESIVVDGSVQPVDRLVDLLADRPPLVDYLKLHSAGKILPTATTPGIANVIDYGADPSGSIDSTEAIERALADAPSVLIPKGTFLISNTLSLKSDTTLVGLHPYYSRIRAIDSPGDRFGPDGSDPLSPIPMVISPDKRDARTTLSMLTIQAPHAVASHSETDVIPYPLKWQSGRFSVIHHCYFGPSSETNWRIQYVMGNAFKLSQETGKYVNGGLQLHSNDPLERLFIEARPEGTAITMPFMDDGSELTITAADSPPFALQSFELSKATFGPGVSFDVTITGQHSDGTTSTETIPFTEEWIDREQLKTVQLNWTDLDEVTIRAPLPFGVRDIVSSEGTTDFARRRPYYVAVACEDSRLGFEHFPFASIHHPQVLITGNGGGRWYNSFQHGDIWADADFRFIEVRDTHEPLNIYHWHLQHVHSDSGAVFQNAQFVSIFGLKSEHNSRFLSVYDSDHIRVFGWGGLADADAGGSHFYFEDTPNFLHAAMAEEPHFMEGIDVLSSCDNPLIIRDVGTFDGIKETFGGIPTNVSNLSRTILFKRGDPINGFSIDTFENWQLWTGESLSFEPNWPHLPELLRFAYRVDLDTWLGEQDPISLEQLESGWHVFVRSPKQASAVSVYLRMASTLSQLGDSARLRLSPEAHHASVGYLQAFALEDAEPIYMRLEAEPATSN